MSPKFIDNRKYAKKAPASTSADEVPEAECIIKCTKEDKFIKSATFLKDGYHTVNYVDQMMKDIERLCFWEGYSYDIYHVGALRWALAN